MRSQTSPAPHASPLAPHPQAIGLLGGTFDPIHLGHLRLAEEMAEAIGLDAVRFLPTGTPPHRGQPQASAAHRLEMVRLAIAGNPRFAIDEREIHKAEPCYMVDTLVSLRAEVGDDTPVVLFLGADAFAGLATWHEWRRLFGLAHLAIGQRPGYSGADWEASLPSELGRKFRVRLKQTSEPLLASAAGSLYAHAITQLDISATRLRGLLGTRRSARYLLPDSVLAYIDHHRLYL